MSPIEEPMGNAELRLTLQRIEEKTDIAIEKVTKTNGSVGRHQWYIVFALGALSCLVPWAGWVTNVELNRPAQISQQQLQSAVQQAVTNSLILDK